MAGNSLATLYITRDAKFEIETPFPLSLAVALRRLRPRSRRNGVGPEGKRSNRRGKKGSSKHRALNSSRSPNSSTPSAPLLFDSWISESQSEAYLFCFNGRNTSGTPSFVLTRRKSSIRSSAGGTASLSWQPEAVNLSGMWNPFLCFILQNGFLRFSISSILIVLNFQFTDLSLGSWMCLMLNFFHINWWWIWLYFYIFLISFIKEHLPSLNVNICLYVWNMWCKGECYAELAD